MKKHEAIFTTRFKKWLRSRDYVEYAAAFEIKVTAGFSVPFSDVQPHQVGALLQVRNNFFSFKIPDAGYQNPFDMFVMANQRAYVVVAFLTPRKPASVWLVDINTFVKMEADEERKSMTELMLKDWGCEHHTI